MKWLEKYLAHLESLHWYLFKINKCIYKWSKESIWVGDPPCSFLFFLYTNIAHSFNIRGKCPIHFASLNFYKLRLQLCKNAQKNKWNESTINIDIDDSEYWNCYRLRVALKFCEV